MYEFHLNETCILQLSQCNFRVWSNLTNQQEGTLIFKSLSKKSFTNSNTQSMFIKHKTEPGLCSLVVDGNAYYH